MNRQNPILQALLHAHHLGLSPDQIARLQRKSAADEARSRGQRLSDERNFICSGDPDPEPPHGHRFDRWWLWAGLGTVALVLLWLRSQGALS